MRNLTYRSVASLVYRLMSLVFLVATLAAGAAEAQINAYVTNQTNNTVSVIDTATNTITATVSVGATPGGIAITPNRAFVYVCNVSGNSVSVIDTATNTVTATVPVGSTPFSVAITPNGAFAYVANLRGNNVSVIATATNTVAATVAVGAFPIAVAITPNGAFAYVANEGGNSVSVIATATNTVAVTVTGTRLPFSVAVSPNGASAYVGHFLSPGVGAVSVIDTATNTITATVAVGNQPDGIAFTPNGAFAYVANFVGSSVSVINTASLTVTATISSAAARTPSAVAITPNGAFAYVANFNSNNASVIDTAANAIAALIPGLAGPAGVAITPNRAPVAKCKNVTVAAGPSCTANASVNDGSFDPDGDTITTSQSPAGPYPLGTTSVTLTVTDSFGASSQCTATVTVVDTTPPVITLNGASTITVECATGFVDPGATAFDNCAGSVPVAASGSVNLGVPGSYTITYTASDGANAAVATRTVIVVDTTPPMLALKPSIALWPPNHKYRTVTIADMIAGVSDGCNTSVGLNSVVITRVTSDEGSLAGNDILIAPDCRSVQLRSERDGGGDGRVYTITLRVTDSSGNSTTGIFRVTVPHSQNGDPAVDSGIRYTVTSLCP